VAVNSIVVPAPCVASSRRIGRGLRRGRLRPRGEGRSLEARDETELVREDGRSFELRAKMRPFGAIVRIKIELEDVENGTRVTMGERPVEGPVAAIWNPVFDAALWLRNVFALRRLRDLVVRRAPARPLP
jgi:hypothetical protein